MTKNLKLKKIIIFIFVTLLLVYILFFSLPRSVKSFGPIKLGDQAPVMAENVFEYKLLYGVKYKFYVYAIEKHMTHCAFGDCGMSGVLVDCMGGWLSGENVMGDGDPTEYGLDPKDVEASKSSMIIVADENKKIVGIYPNYRVRNIPYILKNHRNLSDEFDFCYDIQMPKRW